MIKDLIKEQLKKAVKDLTGLEVEPEVSRPGIASHGDYSSNIAMLLISKLKTQRSKIKSPMDLAQKIIGNLELEIGNLKFLDHVEAVAPGFINFWFSNDYLIDSLTQIDSTKQNFSSSEKLANKKTCPPPARLALRLKAGWSLRPPATTTSCVVGRGSSVSRRVMVEFACPNTHKEFHIGHLRNITIGESICRLLKSEGADVFRANYQGDIGLHVAKALYGLLQISNIKCQISNLEKKSPREKVQFLAEAYTAGAKAYEESGEAKKEIQEINKKIYAKDPSILELWQKTRQWSLDYFDLIYKRLGSHFDRLYFESEVFAKGKEMVEKYVQDGIFQRDQGALIFNGEKYGLHKRVFVTKDGNATYEGKEMALGFLEYSDFPFDLCVHVVAQEQADYFKVVFKALELIDGKFKNKEKHLSYGMVELKSGKMSSRSGNIITAEWLLDEVKRRIKNNFAEMDVETAEKVAVGAVKYSMLKFAPASNINFSFDESINLEGNSGPYLQYTYARTQSVLRKSSSSHSEFISESRQKEILKQVQDDKPQPEEVSLLRSLNQFPEMVGEAADGFAPNILCNYLFDLAQKFNLFYQKHPILKSEQKDFRLKLTASVGQVLKQGLSLLGIEAVERM